MQTVMIESPYTGSPINRPYLHLCVYDSLLRGEAPFASHGFYTWYLDDLLEEERKLGMECGWAWQASDLVKQVFYVDLGMSKGMQEAFNKLDALFRNLEKEFDKPIKYFLERIPHAILMDDVLTKMLMRCVAHELHGRQLKLRINHVRFVINNCQDLIVPGPIGYDIMWTPPKQ
jgi:hypothetical protein